MLLGISGDRLTRVQKVHRGQDMRSVGGQQYLRPSPARADVHQFLLTMYHSTAELEPTTSAPLAANFIGPSDSIVQIDRLSSDS